MPKKKKQKAELIDMEAENPGMIESTIFLAELEKGLDDSLFREEKGSVRETNKRIKEIREELERMQNDCYPIEFSATVEEIKYKDKDTMLTARVPDDIIEDLNKQKYRLEAYKIKLIPSYAE